VRRFEIHQKGACGEPDPFSTSREQRLRATVHTTASVRRTPGPSDDPFCKIPLEQLVPGDVVRLSAGDMLPANLRLLEAKDLFINQAALTGEAMPAEKYAHASDEVCEGPFGLPNLCFMGANVVSGYATGVILRTGPDTFFGGASLPIRSPGGTFRPPSTRASTGSPG
jgi:P-type Mg2+ transporter